MPRRMGCRLGSARSHLERAWGVWTRDATRTRGAGGVPDSEDGGEVSGRRIQDAEAVMEPMEGYTSRPKRKMGARQPVGEAKQEAREPHKRVKGKGHGAERSYYVFHLKLSNLSCTVRLTACTLLPVWYPRRLVSRMFHIAITKLRGLPRTPRAIRRRLELAAGSSAFVASALDVLCIPGLLHVSSAPLNLRVAYGMAVERRAGTVAVVTTEGKPSVWTTDSPRRVNTFVQAVRIDQERCDRLPPPARRGGASNAVGRGWMKSADVGADYRPTAKSIRRLIDGRAPHRQLDVPDSSRLSSFNASVHGCRTTSRIAGTVWAWNAADGRQEQTHRAMQFMWVGGNEEVQWHRRLGTWHAHTRHFVRASPPSMLSESPAALPPTLPESPVTPPPTLPDSSATPPPTRPDSPVASSSTQGSFPLLPDAGKGKTSAKRKRDEDAAVGSMSGHSFCPKRVKLRASGLHECTWPDCQVRGLRSKDMWAHVMTHEPGLRHEPPAAAQVRCLWAGCSVEPGTPDVIGSHMKTAHGVVDARGKQDSKAACQCPDPQCKEKTQSRHGQSWKGWQVQWAEYQRHCESTHWLCGKDVAFCEICGGRPRTTAWEDPKRRMLEKCLEALLHRESFKKGDRAKLLDEKREEEEWNTARPQYRA
ncbi:predicted protein [Postia placenta Mad-698-R]|nr:predicted protein [Postia placenta Mad-698-R]